MKNLNQIKVIEPRNLPQASLGGISALPVVLAACVVSLACVFVTTTASPHTLDLTSRTNSEAWVQFQCGRNFELGQGGNADLSRAAQCYLKAAEAGLAQAQFNLARLYIAGEG